MTWNWTGVFLIRIPIEWDLEKGVAGVTKGPNIRSPFNSLER